MARKDDVLTEMPPELMGEEGLLPAEGGELSIDEEVVEEVPDELAEEGEAVSGLTLTLTDYPALSDMDIGDRVTLEVSDVDEARENFSMNFIEV